MTAGFVQHCCIVEQRSVFTYSGSGRILAFSGDTDEMQSSVWRAYADLPLRTAFNSFFPFRMSQNG